MDPNNRKDETDLTEETNHTPSKNALISQKVLNWIVIVWLCMEAGQFVEARIPWGENPLYWPLWIALSLVVILGLKVLDINYTSRL